MIKPQEKALLFLCNLFSLPIFKYIYTCRELKMHETVLCQIARGYHFLYCLLRVATRLFRDGYYSRKYDISGNSRKIRYSRDKKANLERRWYAGVALQKHIIPLSTLLTYVHSCAVGNRKQL